MQKKGQAAMEFLMTYGWAILAAIVVIGILGVYFFSSDVLTPKSAIVSAPFYANAWNVVGGTGVTLELKNNGGVNYDSIVVDINNPTIGGTDTIGCTPDAGNPTSIDAGDAETFLIDCGSATTDVGEVFKGDIIITYQKANSDVDLTSSGSITESIV